MRNRRPRLKKEPSPADLAAEAIRSTADALGIRIESSFVIRYRSRSEYASVRLPAGTDGEAFMREATPRIDAALLGRSWSTDFYDARRRGVDVLVSVEVSR